MGETTVHGAHLPPGRRKPEGAVQGNVFGTYLHGLFDTGELTERLAQWLLSRKGLAERPEVCKVIGRIRKSS